MGKKSRLKRERRKQPKNFEEATKPEHFLATLLGQDVPQSEWPPDEVEMIQGRLEEMRQIGVAGCVKRRPDGTLTIMSEPEFDFPGDKAPWE